ncbi:TPA: restriction endonuclease subunit S [Streptococcus suis]
MPNKDRNIPKRRFKEFENEDAWELRKLGEVSSHRGGTAIENFFSEDGKYKVISIGSYGLDNKYVDQNIRAVENEVTRLRVVNKNELTMVLNDKTANGNIIGRCLLIETDDEFVINQRTEIINFDNEVNPKFAYVVLNGVFREQVKKIVQGGTQIYVNYSSVEQLSFSLPTLPEQKAIGTFFSTLDRQITLHQRKLDKLKHVKQAYLSEMFPAEGERVPKRRFPGFTDDWELRKFDKITFLAGQKNKNNLPYESYSVTNDKGFVPQNEQFEKGGTMATADKSMYYIVSPSSFAYNPARINIGSIGYYNQPENVIVSSLYEVFKTTDEVYDRFLWHWFKSDIFKKKIEELQEGGVRLYFYYDKLCKCSLFLPSIQEQKIIGDRLDSLDRQITLHQRKLEKLKNLKKALLNELFV